MGVKLNYFFRGSNDFIFFGGVKRLGYRVDYLCCIGIGCLDGAAVKTSRDSGLKIGMSPVQDPA